MAKRNEYDPKNPAHRELAKVIKEKRASLSPAEKKALADELNGAQNMGKINKLLR